MPVVRREIEQTLSAKTADEWEEIVAGVGVAASAVRTMNEAVASPQIVHRGFIHSFDVDPALGVSISVPKASYQFSETPAIVQTPPPRFGQHTVEVLQEMGYDESRIADLRNRGIV
jgi:crotonobetainyl-CoA:carnitine CoA-transferase CaiB-like acyl-CoA transferase